MTKPRFLVDVDGVLADFLNPCLKIINDLTGWDKKLQDMNSWHIFKSLDVPKEIEDRAYEIMKSPGWCLSLRPISGAVVGIDKLREIGKIYFVTSPMRGPNWTYERTLWLQKFFDAEWDDVIHCSAKHVCAGDVFIDDKVAHLARWKISHPEGLAIKFESDHNRSETWDRVIRSWENFPELKFGGDRKWHP